VAKVEDLEILGAIVGAGAGEKTREQSNDQAK
jgi:hypothetical protein